MRGNDLVGHEPTGVRWSQDSRRVYFRWKRAGEPRLKETDLYVADRDGSGLRRLTEEEAQARAAGRGRAVERQAPDGLCRGRRSLSLRPRERRAAPADAHRRWGERPALHARPAARLPSRGRTTSTCCRSRRAARTADGHPHGRRAGRRTRRSAALRARSSAKKQERGLIEAVRERAAQREEQEARRRRREPRKPFNLPAGQSPANLNPSPGGKYVAVTVVQPAAGAKNTIVPNYVTESAYTEDIPSRPKVGDAQGRARMAVIEIETGEAGGSSTGSRPRGRRKKVRASRASARRSSPGCSGRERATAPSSSRARPTTKTAGCSPSTRRAARRRVLDRLHDDAWVGRPRGLDPRLARRPAHAFTSSPSATATRTSTRSAVDGGEPRQLTSGKFEVSDVRLSADKTKFYFTLERGRPGRAPALLRCRSGAGARTRLTAMPGRNAGDALARRGDARARAVLQQPAARALPRRPTGPGPRRGR